MIWYTILYHIISSSHAITRSHHHMRLLGHIIIITFCNRLADSWGCHAQCTCGSWLTAASCSSTGKPQILKDRFSKSASYWIYSWDLFMGCIHGIYSCLRLNEPGKGRSRDSAARDRCSPCGSRAYMYRMCSLLSVSSIECVLYRMCSL